ncbi:MAG TPA: helix-turn-helix transcriptional regulator [Acidimicrobiales bacterium]|nr:helix-turn-helix transcriptional regulator [Acidimicrobiales bacterium]
MTDAGALLYEARHRAGLSQAELARRAGIPRSVLNAYERGRRQPGADTFLRILDAADIEVRLSNRTRRAEEEYLGRILGLAIGLADALPLERNGPLTYPNFGRRVG